MLKKYLNSFLLVFLVFLSISLKAQSPQKIPLKIGIMQPNTILTSFSDERYRRVLESSLYYGIGDTAKKIKECGYKISFHFDYYDPKNIPEILQRTQAIDNDQNIWTIIGPASGRFFELISDKLQKTPMISPMAESQTVVDLPAPYFTKGTGMKRLAIAAVQVILKESLGKSYAVFSEKGCLECREFESAFHTAATSQLQNFYNLEAGPADEPDLSQLILQLQTKPVDILVLPNRSKFSGYVMQQLHKQFPKLKYVGNVSWGQTLWGFIPDYKLPSSINATVVRSGLSPELMNQLYDVDSLAQNWFSSTLRAIEPPHLAYFTIETIRNIVDDLCKYRPRTKAHMLSYMSSLDRDHFLNKAGVGVYKLKDGQVQFAYRFMQ